MSTETLDPQAAALSMSPRERLMALHEETFRHCQSIMRAKSNDYANGTDPYVNFRAAEMFGLHPVSGILLRVTDKLQRIRTFATTGELKVSGESVDDACDDIVNYAILMKGLLREQRERVAKREGKDWP